MNITKYKNLGEDLQILAQLSENFNNKVKNVLSPLLGKYYKIKQTAIHVVGINIKNNTILIEKIKNGDLKGRNTYIEHLIEISLEAFLTNEELVESSALEFLTMKRIAFSNVDTYYNVELIDINIDEFFEKHDINNYILV